MTTEARIKLILSKQIPVMAPNTAVNRSQLKERLSEGRMGIVYQAPDIEATPLLPGTTLAALLQASSSRLTPDFVVKIMVQVCRSVQTAHDKGILPGVPNPGNILILEDNTAQIVDFGLSHTAGTLPANGWVGALDYLAPEQLGYANANRSSDVFSLGVIAYEALTLRQPFRRLTLEKTAEAIRHFVPEPISEENSKVPEPVSQAVEVALAKLPEHRYASAGEFADMLEKAGAQQQSECFVPASSNAIAHHLQIEEHRIARNEKEKLFTVAQRHHRNGQLSSALTQLEKLLTLSRNVPGSSIAEREKVFEALYAELQSERDRINECCSEAARALAENNFEKALAICESLQARYPNNQEFQALRLKAQQAQRQQLLTFVGEVAHSVEAEPNLDGRVCLLQEAVKRYPNEELLASQLSLACEQRDLAASIIAKARAYEVEGQLAEAIHQWTALLNIYPLYPGLAAEIQQLEQKAEEGKRSRFATEIDRGFASDAHTDAERLSQEGLREFPEQPQLFVAKAKRKKVRQPALLEAGSGINSNGDQTIEPARVESIPAPQPTKLFLDDDFLESSSASHRTAPQPPRSSRGPAILEQFREIGSVLVYNVKNRLLDSNLAPHFQKLSESSRIPFTARQIRTFLFGLMGALVPLLLLSSAYRYVSRPHLSKPMTTPEARISPASPAPPVAIRTAPSFATDGDPDASATPPLESVSRQRTFDSSVADQAVERPAAERSLPSVSPADTLRSERVANSLPAATASLIPDSPHPKRPVAIRKGAPNRRFDIPAKAPLPAQLTISSGTPGANVLVDDVTIGELDEKGNFAYAGITAGTHKIELRKPGHGSRTFYGQTFLPGKPFDLPGDKQLTAVAGYARITVSPLSASVSYQRSGESAKHAVSDLDRALALPPGAYEFTAEAPHFAAKLVDVKIQADQTATISLELKPSARTVVEQNTELVNPDEAIKSDGRWYHGRTDKYIRLTTNSSTNTLLFSKEFKVKRTSWRVNLDGNMITYTLDGKGISIEKHINAHDSTERIKTDLSNATAPFESYAVTVKLEKNDVIIARPDGTPIHTTHTEDHDWSQAAIFAKGDTYFSFLPGR